MTQPSILTVHAHENILQYVADFISAQYLKNDGTQNATLNDLSNLYIFLPHAHADQQFIIALASLLNADITAFIPPWSGTLRNWVTEFPSNTLHIQQSEKQLINDFSRQLLFIEALQQYPDLFRQENQWQVTQALLKLFDELSLNQQDIFSTAKQFQDTLQQAYGIDDPHQHLLNESNLVYTLWQAWQQQLDENSLIDDSGDYLSRLEALDEEIGTQNRYSEHQYICIGYAHYTKTEQDFIQKLIDNGQCQVIDFAEDSTPDNEKENNTDSVFSNFIKETFAPTGLPINQRAQQFTAENTYPEKADTENELFKQIPLSTCLASSEEQQIRAIDIYVRLKILDGKRNIAIISEDRKLSRRLRALLERANVQLQDKAGWSLATTQASTIIERWLECIEEDFNAYPLLDCLKSPFINIAETCAGNPEEPENLEDKSSALNNYKKNIYRFEHDLIFHENVSSNINKYKDKLKQRLKRLSHWPANSYDELTGILDFIEATAQPLLQLHASDKNGQATDLHASDFLGALTTSLDQLGVLRAYKNDNAGILLLKTLEALEQSLQHADPILSWHDCRVWLGMALESQNFTPQSDRSNVQLMTLEQASYLNFDCIVIASCDSKHFPGSAKNSPFFNQAVRASLQLETWETLYQQRLDLFKRTLLAAPEVLITACNEENGEEKPVSPWLELLINFYQLAFHKELNNEKLQQLVNLNTGNSYTDVFVCDENSLPAESEQPSPAVPKNLLPERVSASAYQRIINCPYQYFSADALQLRALEELSDELKKSDYGERIHFILQIFHNGHDKFGKAFTETITEDNREEAENYLIQISNKVFHNDLENNVLHRSWLHRWNKHIPAYINWQMQHQSDWNIYQTEKNMETTISRADEDADKRTGKHAEKNELVIYGRLDRIDIHTGNDKNDQSHAIIDYKTGRTAKQEDVDNGENVQLSMYSLLDKDASNVSYLSVDSSYQKVETRSFLADEELEGNREKNKHRLLEIFNQMDSAAPMPAWGDDTVCVYCNFSGLCRKAEWTE